VNYHFGGKLNLYTELFRQTLVELRERRAAWIEAALAEPDASLQSLLRAFCDGFVDPLMEDGRGQRLMELYGREMQEPLMPPNLFFEELVNPMRRLMRQAFARVCPELPDDRVEPCLMSLVGQLLHALHMAQHVARMGGQGEPAVDMAATIDHIVTFSAAGIRSVASQGAR
jgi:AcrR family transcriptional regulator